MPQLTKMNKPDDVHDITGVSFKNPNLLKEALTHRSYPNENSSWPHRNNERLEFLGDAVLELTVTEYLFEHFEKKEEGDLTIYRAALVNTEVLSEAAHEIGLDKKILLSKGEARGFSGRARMTISANALEAVIGAIYLDQGYEVARDFIYKTIVPRISKIEEEGGKDPKSLVQEYAQSEYKITPTYKLLNEKGPAHERRFRVGLYFDDELKSEGEGRSKQEAETKAAQIFLDSNSE